MILCRFRDPLPFPCGFSRCLDAFSPFRNFFATASVFVLAFSLPSPSVSFHPKMCIDSRGLIASNDRVAVPPEMAFYHYPAGRVKPLDLSSFYAFRHLDCESPPGGKAFSFKSRPHRLIIRSPCPFWDNHQLENIYDFLQVKSMIRTCTSWNNNHL